MICLFATRVPAHHAIGNVCVATVVERSEIFTRCASQRWPRRGASMAPAGRARPGLGKTFVPGWQSLTMAQQQWRSPLVRTHGDGRQRRQRTENEQGRMRALRQKAALEHTAADISCIDRALWTSVFSALWSYLRQHLMLSLSL